MPEIFEYSDYRNFLRDFYDAKRKEDRKFSQRYFASKAGVSSSGFFSDVMSGKRNLTDWLILRFSSALKLNRQEQEYFEYLVGFNQAKTLEEKNHYYGKILHFKKVKVTLVDKDQHEFYSKWYYSAIRELLYFYRFKNDYSALAKKLNPPIRPHQAKTAVTTLEKLGLIKKDPNGYYVQTSSLLSTGKEFRSVNAANFQNAMLDLAREAIDRHPPEHRDFSTVTVTLSEKSLNTAKTEIEKLRKKILKIAQDDMEVNSVFQFNLNLFPLTKMEGQDKDEKGA